MPQYQTKYLGGHKDWNDTLCPGDNCYDDLKQPEYYCVPNET